MLILFWVCLVLPKVPDTSCPVCKDTPDTVVLDGTAQGAAKASIQSEVVNNTFFMVHEKFPSITKRLYQNVLPAWVLAYFGEDKEFMDRLREFVSGKKEPTVNFLLQDLFDIRSLADSPAADEGVLSVKYFLDAQLGRYTVIGAMTQPAPCPPAVVDILRTIAATRSSAPVFGQFSLSEIIYAYVAIAGRRAEKNTITAKIPAFLALVWSRERTEIEEVNPATVRFEVGEGVSDVWCQTIDAVFAQIIVESEADTEGSPNEMTADQFVDSIGCRALQGLKTTIMEQLPVNHSLRLALTDYELGADGGPAVGSILSLVFPAYTR